MIIEDGSRIGANILSEDLKETKPPSNNIDLGVKVETQAGKAGEEGSHLVG